MTPSNRLPHQTALPVVAACCFVMAIILGAHYATQQTPNAIALTVPIINLPVYWYGIVIMTAIALATWLVSQLLNTLVIWEYQHAEAAQEAEKAVAPAGDAPEQSLWERTLQSTDHHPDHAWNVVVYMLVLGVIGARLYHVLTPQPSLGISPVYYFANPIEIVNLRNGGLGIFGAIAGAVLGLSVYTARHRLSLMTWLDLGALAGSFAQFVGRWANYFNQELYGQPSSLPWAITIDNPPAALADFSRFHPAFLYESIWSLLTFLLLYRLWPAKHTGSLAAVYICCYGFGRILLETIRIDSNTTGSIPTASLVSGGMIAIGLIALGLLRRR